MSAQTIYITGVGKWVRAFESQMDTKFGERFHVTIMPDEASKVVLKSSGSRVKARDDEEGTWFKFSRDNKKEFNGKMEMLGPPQVLAADGKTPFDKVIGNGSKLTVKLTVYDSQYGKGTRLEAIRVDAHVPYEQGDASEYPF